jgi:hypothetical protein
VRFAFANPAQAPSERLGHAPGVGDPSLDPEGRQLAGPSFWELQPVQCLRADPGQDLARGHTGEVADRLLDDRRVELRRETDDEVVR